jgi:hypothetical protein
MDTPSKLTLTYKGFDPLVWFSFAWIQSLYMNFQIIRILYNIKNELDVQKNRAVTILQVYLKWSWDASTSATCFVYKYNSIANILTQDHYKTLTNCNCSSCLFSHNTPIFSSWSININFSSRTPSS